MMRKSTFRRLTQIIILTSCLIAIILGIVSTSHRGSIDNAVRIGPASVLQIRTYFWLDSDNYVYFKFADETGDRASGANSNVEVVKVNIRTHTSRVLRSIPDKWFHVAFSSVSQDQTKLLCVPAYSKVGAIFDLLKQNGPQKFDHSEKQLFNGWSKDSKYIWYIEETDQGGCIHILDAATTNEYKRINVVANFNQIYRVPIDNHDNTVSYTWGPMDPTTKAFTKLYLVNVDMFTGKTNYYGPLKPPGNQYDWILQTNLINNRMLLFAQLPQYHRTWRSWLTFTRPKPSAGYALFTCNRDGTNMREEFSGEWDEKKGMPHDFQWTPDGNHISFELDDSLYVWPVHY